MAYLVEDGSGIDIVKGCEVDLVESLPIEVMGVAVERVEE